LLALIITVSNVGEMIYQAKRFFIPEIIPLVWITIFFVTLLHELSHTYSCRLHGGRVTDMGFLLLYLQPCFYSNVSDAYLFPEKKKRIAVTSAGIISQIVIWAVAVMVWRITSTDNLINTIAFIIIALSFVGITFNINPLLKLDGYYFLVDYWEIANLRQKAFLYIRQRILGLAPQEQPMPVSSREKKIFLFYGGASLLYSGALIGYIMFRAGKFINQQFGLTGLAIFSMIILYFILDAMNKGNLFKVAYNQRGAILKPNRLITIGAIIAVLLVLIIFIKAPLRITHECEILPLEQISLCSSYPGAAELYIEKINEERQIKQYQLVGMDYSILSITPAVKVGDRVNPGDLIASIKSNVYESDKLERLANLQTARKQLDLLQEGSQPEEIEQTEDVIAQIEAKIEKSTRDLNRAETLYARDMISASQIEEQRTANQVLKSELNFYQNQLILLKRGARPEEIDIARANVSQLEAKLQHLNSQLEQTVIESPINGIVTQIKNGDTLITIARIDTVRVRILVPEKEISAVSEKNRIRMKVRSYPGLTYSGFVTRIEPMAFRGENDRQIVKVYALVSNGENLLKPGMTGKAKISCGNLPIYKLILWRAVRFLRIEFWSWW
jgi:putative peptide zinc metalloprotease protein